MTEKSNKKPEAPALETEGSSDTSPVEGLDPAVAQQIATMRSHIREGFGKVAMAMMLLPRYRNQTLGDLQHLLLEPLLRDRVAIAYPGATNDDSLADIAGVAIWASVSDDVDMRIREQIRAGVFPVRLKAEDWTSGSINWLLDVIAPDATATARVIANFKQVVKQGSLRLHPIITRLVDADTLEKMGAAKMGAVDDGGSKAVGSMTVPEGATVN
jgi:cytolysin-activating lysine-acyltransferase